MASYYEVIDVLQRELNARKVDVSEDAKSGSTIIRFIDCSGVNESALRVQPKSFRHIKIRVCPRTDKGLDVVVEVPKLQGYGYAWWQWLLLIGALAVLAWGVIESREACLTYAPNAPWCHKDTL